MLVVTTASSGGSGFWVSISISVLSGVFSLFAVVLSYRKYKEQQRQGDEIERQSKEIERQSSAMEREFATEIIAHDYEAVGNTIQVTLSNYGRGIGKNLEIATEVIVDGEDCYTTPNYQPLRQIDDDTSMAGPNVIKADTSKIEYQADPALRITIPGNEPRNSSFPGGLEDLKPHCSDFLEIDMYLRAENQLEVKNEYEVFDSSRTVAINDIEEEYPTLESVLQM
ncbi:hypothetical protein [Halanaeroarchaeum sp. HSR-CO]|uniref:hypothetical protein n=1 Tax=Halanaeroarchaeum sp. HSR-CO TaxID=2866382 RepID=UPI00217D57EF|nr:hypothetical protein [Halanaeroarchaeum sp. HSR-CO]